MAVLFAGGCHGALPPAIEGNLLACIKGLPGATGGRDQHRALEHRQLCRALTLANQETSAQSLHQALFAGDP
ncbi:hypothetical protein D3C80_2038180 [compost metagenome]